MLYEQRIEMQDGRAFDAQYKAIPLAGSHKQAELQDARTAEDMWKAIGTDSWVVVPIQSAARPGHIMEGTRLTLVRPGGLFTDSQGHVISEGTRPIAS